MNRRPLAEVAHITAGFAIATAVSHDPDAGFQVLLPRHIGEEGGWFRYNDAEHATRMALPDRANRYLLQAGDVVVVARGERNRAALVVDCPYRTVASSAMLVLRPRKELVVPEFLEWQLNQVQAQAAIAQARKGSTSPMVTADDLGEVEIAVPDLATQRRVVQVVELVRAEQELLAKLAGAVRRRNRAVACLLLTGRIQTTEI